MRGLAADASLSAPSKQELPELVVDAGVPLSQR
jgi:hypothetical protein